MFVTNWISTTKIQKISEITNFFRHYFLSRTEVVLCNEVKYGTSDFAVLILIIVDNGLVQALLHLWCKDRCSLNPYYSGQWSSTEDPAEYARVKLLY